MKVMEKKRYRNLNGFLRDLFGEKVYKVGLYGGFTCPNRDGTAGVGGCTFCNPASSRPVKYRDGMTIEQQLDEGCRYISRRHGASKFIAYFQDYSTTYGSPGALGKIYRKALSHPEIVGLSLCTRPDCLDDDVLDLLKDISRETFLWVEVGVQSASETLLTAMNRCHTHADSVTSFKRLRERNIHSSAHVILGYPGETREDRIDTAIFVNDSGALGVKVQNLHVVTGSPLEAVYRRGEFDVMEFEQYVEYACDFIEHISPRVVIQRLTGEAPAELTVSPEWSLRKMMVLERFRNSLSERDRWQGKALGFPVSTLEQPLLLPD
jgi:hypothetical protein